MIPDESVLKKVRKPILQFVAGNNWCSLRFLNSLSPLCGIRGVRDPELVAVASILHHSPSDSSNVDHALHHGFNIRKAEAKFVEIVGCSFSAYNDSLTQDRKVRSQSKVYDTLISSDNYTKVAFDLIKLYAKRKEKIGFSFNPDSSLQWELEASFLFEDTPDQN